MNVAFLTVLIVEDTKQYVLFIFEVHLDGGPPLHCIALVGLKTVFERIARDCTRTAVFSQYTALIQKKQICHGLCFNSVTVVN